ncbi:unnamed protein product, partial [Mesorhabditis belari]
MEKEITEFDCNGIIASAFIPEPPPIKLLCDEEEIALSFSGAGFLAAYHFGVTACLVKNGEELLKRVEKVAGCSAGSLCATLVILAPNRLEEARLDTCNLAAEVRAQPFGALTPGYYLHERVKSLVDKYIPDDISVANGKLLISVTEKSTRENKMISEFETRDELISALSASCFIPFYSGLGCLPPQLRDQEFVDGGLSNNLPRVDGMRTVAISPFASHDAEISPLVNTAADWMITLGQQSIKLNRINGVRAMDALFPPRPDVVQRYYEEGFSDAFRFLCLNNLIKRQNGTQV